MTIIWEDEHYIWEQTSINNNWTITVTRKEKPKLEKFVKKLKYKDMFNIAILWETKEEEWITYIQIDDIEEWTSYIYDNKIWKFNKALDDYISYIKEYFNKEDEKEQVKKYEDSYLELMQNIVDWAKIRYNPKKYIDKLRDSHKDRVSMIKTIKSFWWEPDDLEKDLNEIEEMIEDLSKYLNE